MAAPPDLTMSALRGTFSLNKALSDSADEILRLQGVSWFKRRAIAVFTPSLCITHTTDAGIERLDVVQTLSGGLSGAVRETYTLDGGERDKNHDLFGFITGRSRRTSVETLTDAYLKEDWTEDGIVLSEHWSTPGKNGYTWKGVQVWGLAVVDGERRYVRRTSFTSPQKGDPILVRFVYDYVGTA